MEDLDATRVRAEAAITALDDLRWLGFDWDEGPDVGGPSGPYVQSLRTSLYAEALDRLRAEEHVYPCTCTRAEISRAASAPHAEDEGPSYPGTCAGRTAADAVRLGDRAFTWRFRVLAGPVRWHDAFQDELAVDLSVVGGDFLVARQGMGASYQLAVVADDALMGITQVIRGLDLVPSTPRQILLYQALGFPIPEFGHVGLVLGPDGRRLAKRDGSVKLATLRAAGADPQRIIGRLAASLGLSDLAVASQSEDWVGSFAAKRVVKTDWMLANEDLAGVP